MISHPIIAPESHHEHTMLIVPGYSPASKHYSIIIGAIIIVAIYTTSLFRESGTIYMYEYTRLTGCCG